MAERSLIYKGFDPDQEKLREALCTLGNGYFATRGAGPESTADEIHYPGTYLAGGYNRLQTEIAGRRIENEDLVNMPNWLPLNFRINGRKWFDLKEVEILDYRQELDLKRGMLFRTVRFRDDGGNRTRLEERRIIHMGEPHLAALESFITAENWSGRLEVRTALEGRIINDGVERYRGLKNQHLEPIETRQIENDTICLKVRTNQSRLTIAQAARTRIYLEGKPYNTERKTFQKPGYIAQQFQINMAKGNKTSVEKVVAFYTSRDNGISECGLEAEKSVSRAGNFENLVQSHALAWDHLWNRFNIDFQSGEPDKEGKEYPAMIVHLYIFHLLQTTSLHSMDLDVGVPSRGWHGEAYRGHIFWDELFIFPFLNLQFPEITRSLLMYRYRRLNEARAAARQSGYQGAMYPWQSGSNGREESQAVHLNPKSGRWLPDNSHLQRHVNAAIAWNVCQYYEVTGDMEFMSYYGAEMVLEIARFWASISEYNNETERYEIVGVMGPDEYHDSYPGAERPGLNNNAYTNIMAVWVLTESLNLLNVVPEDRAQELKEKLGLYPGELGRWKDISRKMSIPFHGDGIISQFEGYDKLEEFDWQGYRKKYGDIQRLDRILEAEDDTPNRYKVSKQADVLMLFYLFSSEELKRLFNQLGYLFDYETIPRNIGYYIKRTSHGSTLSRVVHSWVLARSDRIRSWKLFREALQSDISDIQGGTTPEGIHLGAMAGSVNILQECYTGIETRGNTLRFNPCLPTEMGELSMQIRYRSHSLTVSLNSDSLKVKSRRCSQDPIRIGFKDRFLTLKERESREFSL